MYIHLTWNTPIIFLFIGRTIIQDEAFVRNVNPCMSLICSLIADVTILRCATKFLPCVSIEEGVRENST